MFSPCPFFKLIFCCCCVLSGTLLLAQKDRSGAPNDTIHTQRTVTDYTVGKDSSDIAAKNKGDYRLSLQTSHQPSEDFVNEQDVNFELNRDKIRLITGYSFIYDPFSPEGDLNSRDKEGETHYDLNKRLIYRDHRFFIQMALKLSPKDYLILNNSINFYGTATKDKTANSHFNNDIHTNLKHQAHQFSQIWQRELSASSILEVGAVTYYKGLMGKYNSTGDIENTTQRSHTKIPGFTGLVSLSNKNKLGKTKGTLKYQHFSARQNNHYFGDDGETHPRFKYKEQLLSFQLNQSISLSKRDQINLELTLEKMRAKKDDLPMEYLSPGNDLHDNSTRLAYDFSYSFSPSPSQSYSIGLEKKIIRPQFGQISPLMQIYQDFISTSGELYLKPTRSYELYIKTVHSNWLLHAYAGISKDQITAFYKYEDHHINYSYANFDTGLNAGARLIYDRSFFNNNWHTYNSFEIDYNALKTPSEIHVVGRSPRFEYHSSQHLNLGKGWAVGLDFSFTSSHKNDLSKRLNSSQLDLFIEKRIGENLKFVIFGEDIFKTNRRWEEFYLDNSFYSRNVNLDSNTYGITIRYNLEGKSFRHRSIHTPNDRLLNRLK